MMKAMHGTKQVPAVIYCARCEQPSAVRCAFCDHTLSVSERGVDAILSGATPVCRECEVPFTAYMEARGYHPSERKRVREVEQALIVPGKRDIN